VKTETKGMLTRAFVGHDNGRGSACLAATHAPLGWMTFQKGFRTRAFSARFAPDLSTA
jgi:hypothetical protein